MNGLDTNVILRFLVQDDPAQTRAAAKVVEAAASRQESLFVSLPVICELAWVLARTYGQSREQIAAVLGLVIESPVFDVERPDCVLASLNKFRTGRAGFADYLIGALAKVHGCSHVYTFDRRLRGVEEFRLL